MMHTTTFSAESTLYDWFNFHYFDTLSFRESETESIEIIKRKRNVPSLDENTFVLNHEHEKLLSQQFIYEILALT